MLAYSGCEIDMSFVVLEGYQIEVVRSARAKHLRLSVYRGGRVRLTLPHRASEDDAKRFARERLSWLHRARARMAAADAALMPAIPVRDVVRIRLQAREAVCALLDRYDPVYGYSYGSVRVKRMTTRWGSCSKQGNLNFNIHIVHLPTRLQEYLVVHELCHLREMNHSSRFWALVERTIPDYLDRRRELRSAYRLR